MKYPKPKHKSKKSTYIKRTKLNKKSKNPIKRLKKKADDIFSLYIRLRDKNTCFTCGTKKGTMTNSHYISRNHSSTRYDTQNCSCQCIKCHIFNKAEMPKYTIALQKKYGQDIIQRLIDRSNEIIKRDAQDYQEIIDYYSNKIKTLDKH